LHDLIDPGKVAARHMLWRGGAGTRRGGS